MVFAGGTEKIYDFCSEECQLDYQFEILEWLKVSLSCWTTRKHT